jgi:hypothetical protein
MILVWEFRRKWGDEPMRHGRVEILVAIRRMWRLLKRLKRDEGKGDLQNYFHCRLMQGDSTNREWLVLDDGKFYLFVGKFPNLWQSIAKPNIMKLLILISSEKLKKLFLISKINETQNRKLMDLEIQKTSVLNQNNECMHEKCPYFSNLIRCPLRDPKTKSHYRSYL